MRLGDILRIETRLSRASRHSITFHQRAYIKIGCDAAVEARLINVFFRSRDGQVLGEDNEVFDSWDELRDLSKPSSGT